MLGLHSLQWHFLSLSPQLGGLRWSLAMGLAGSIGATSPQSN